MTKIQKRDIETGLRVVAAVADAIRELGEVPEGHLYGMLMGQMSLAEFEAIMRLLTDQGLIRIENNLITWIGFEVMAKEEN